MKTVSQLRERIEASKEQKRCNYISAIENAVCRAIEEGADEWQGQAFLFSMTEDEYEYIRNDDELVNELRAAGYYLEKHIKSVYWNYYQ